MKAALEEAKEQQQWALSAVVRAKEAEKEDLAQALQCAPPLPAPASPSSQSPAPPQLPAFQLTRLTLPQPCGF